ncbi:MAG: BON domain-containing protein [Kiritimatiellae bacterium]|nr:BON domain-containing protein [Kiritimatiellia bacterium]
MKHTFSRHLRRLAGLLLLAMLVTAAGCATSPGESGWRDLPNDAALAQDIQTRLRDDGIAGRYSFGVTAEQGIVVLRGTVPNDMVRARVIGIALGTPGVVEVVDEIRRQ